MALNDIKGQRFGKLLALQWAEDRICQYSNRTVIEPYWLCQCDCGALSVVRKKNLKYGHTTSCGCKNGMSKRGETMKPKIDLTGQTFGRLTVVRYSHYQNGTSFYECKCICGKEVIASGYRLRTGQTKSCGCLRSANLNGNKNVANICIDCKRSTGLCPWSAADPKTGKLLFEPVPGWTAEKVKLRCGAGRNGEAQYQDTYSIKACPLFERDERKPGEVSDLTKLLKSGED